MRLSTELVEVALGDLAPLVDNPRRLDESGRERLSRSLDQFGLYKPLVVWRDPELDRLVVLAGNQRAEVLRSRGVESVRVVVFEGTRAEARALALRDNNEDGEWSWDDLSRYLSTLEALADDDLDWTLTGFDSDTVDDLLALATSTQSLSGETGQEVVEPSLDANSDPTETNGGTGSDLPTDYVESRFVQATIGNIRGRVSLDVYSRFTKVWSALAEAEGSTDVPILVERLVERLGG